LQNAVRDICNEIGVRPTLLYLSEAHAAETWPLSENAPSMHNSNEDRLSSARSLLETYTDFADILNGEIYIDDIANAITLAYGLWPERYVLLEGNKVIWASTLSFEERCTDVLTQLHAAARAAWR